MKIILTCSFNQFAFLNMFVWTWWLKLIVIQVCLSFQLCYGSKSQRAHSPLVIFFQPYLNLPVKPLTKYTSKLNSQSIIETLLAPRPMPVVPLPLKTNSQVRHKAVVQCSGGSFCVAPPIYYCGSMSFRGQGGRSPQGSLIQEAGSYPQHAPSSLPMTFTFHCRGAVWNTNDTCTASHSISGAVILDTCVTSPRTVWLTLTAVPQMPIWTHLELRGPW